MLRTPVGLVVTGLVLGGAVAGVVIVVRIVDSIMEATCLPRKVGASPKGRRDE